MHLADQLANVIRTHGADTVFGLPGGGPNLEVVGACEAAGLRFVLAHHETAACIMASTYGLLTGRTALAIATRGPGVANAANGLAQATLDRFPLLFVSDCVGATERPRVAHQRFDQLSFTRPITKWSGVAGGDDAAVGVLLDALAIAGSRPAGAVHLDYDPSASSEKPDVRVAVTPTGPADISAARAALTAARFPVVIAGLGVAFDADRIRDALEQLGCPVLTTYQAIGLLPDTHPQFAGLFTSGTIESTLLDQADLVLTVGFDAVEPMPPPWRYTTNVIAVNDCAPVSAFLPTSYELSGGLATMLSELCATPPSTGWSPDAGQAALLTSRALLRGAATSDGFGPLELVDSLIELVAAPEVTVTVDAGAHFLAIMPFWPVAAPHRLLISNGSATMGFALPAAIAAALARPNENVVCLTGDGGLGMCLAELETLARLGLPVTVVVFNDAALTLIEIKQRDGQGGTNAVRYTPVDFAAVARAVGLEAAVVESAEQLGAALRRRKPNGRPLLIDARIDPAAYRNLIRATRG